MSQVQSKTPVLLRDVFPERFVAVGYEGRRIVVEYCVKNTKKDNAYDCEHVYGRVGKTSVEELIEKLRKKGLSTEGAPVYEVKITSNDYWVTGALLAKMFLEEAEKRIKAFRSAFNGENILMNINGWHTFFRCRGSGKPLIIYKDLYILVATGNTYPFRDVLKQVFTWNSEERAWVTAAGDESTFPVFVNRLLAAAELATWLAEQGASICVDTKIMIALGERIEEFKKRYGS